MYIVPRVIYNFTWVAPRVTHGTILHCENLESLKGTFYTTALHIKHLTTEHCSYSYTNMGKFSITCVLHLNWGVYSCKSLPIMMHYLYGTISTIRIQVVPMNIPRQTEKHFYIWTLTSCKTFPDRESLTPRRRWLMSHTMGFICAYDNGPSFTFFLAYQQPSGVKGWPHQTID